MREHAYHLKAPRRIGSLVVGTGMVIIASGLFAVNFRSFLSGNLSFMGYVGFILLLVVFFLVGLLMIASAFSKVIIYPDGLEYHSATLVLKAKWKQLENLGYHHQEHSGKSLIIAPLEGEVVLKSWAKPFKGILKHQARGILISASWFNDNDGNLLAEDIVSYLPGKAPEVI